MAKVAAAIWALLLSGPVLGFGWLCLLYLIGRTTATLGEFLMDLLFPFVVFGIAAYVPAWAVWRRA